MLIIHSFDNRELLEHVSTKYHLVDGDGVSLPSLDVVIDRPSLEGKIAARDRGFDDFDLPLIDDSFTYSGSNGSNTQEDEKRDFESSVRVHDRYDDTTSNCTPLVLTGHVVVSNDDNGDGGGEQPLVFHKRGRGSIASADLAAILSSGERGSVIEFSRVYEACGWFVKLEKVFHGVDMVSQVKMDKVRGELSILQNDKVVLENKLVGYHDEVLMQKDMVASLELEKLGLVDKVAMFEHGVQKLKVDLNDSSL
ncbi:unnamed protein product [Lactuca saligna]|uniref:Uncharacterized protein n=1 Tax=Lactuca saligna TaxID=75948 RepID=A0AA35Z6X7_LACSI|nr:unnamed protein product [Lactuca saligna]